MTSEDTAVPCPYARLIAQETARVHLNLERAKHSGRQFISENQRFTAGMLRPYEDIYQNEMHPMALPCPDFYARLIAQETALPCPDFR